MCIPWFECDEMHDGDALRVVGLRISPDNTPSRRFINRCDKPERTDCWTAVEWVSNNGVHAGKCRKERGTLWAITGPGLIRLLYELRPDPMRKGPMAVVTHGVKKPGNDWEAREWDRADRLLYRHDHEVASETEEA